MLTAVIVIGAVLLFLLLLLALPIKVVLRAKKSVKADIRILFFRLQLLPQKKKRKKKIYKTKKKVTGIEPLDQKIEELSLRDELRLVRGLLAMLVRRRKKWLKLHAARLRIRVATGDAASTAILYGVVCQSLAYILTLLDRVTRVKAKEPEVSVIADFEGERSSADIKIVLTLRVIDVILAMLHLARNEKQQNTSQTAQNTAQDQKGN